MGTTVYSFIKKTLKEQYLKDLGFEYHRNFLNKMECPETDPIFDELNKKRFELE